MKNYRKILIIGAILISMHSCKKDDDIISQPPPPSNEEEVITTVTLTFVDSSNSLNIRTATFRDPDGDGGATYDIFDTIVLEPNKTWYNTVTLLNETVTPADTISNEVLEEAVDHLFCFSPSGTSATVIITDMDSNSLPVGLQSKWRTTSTGNGGMLIELRHQPGIKDGTCSPGNIDVQVDFPVRVE